MVAMVTLLSSRADGGDNQYMLMASGDVKYTHCDVQKVQEEHRVNGEEERHFYSC